MGGGPITFNCVGCGDCCRGKHGYISLTLAESAAWLARGHRVAILLEAVAEEPSESTAAGVPVRSGALDLRVIPTFAGDLLSGCPNLADDNRCRIYADRPLACRIYPAETHPANRLEPALKACPSDAWNPVGGIPIINADGQPPPGLRSLIDAFQQANEDEAPAKAMLCEALDATVTALRGNGYAIHTPTPADFARALGDVLRRGEPRGATSWVLRVHGVELAEALLDQDARLFTGAESPGHVFIALRPDDGAAAHA